MAEFPPKDSPKVVVGYDKSQAVSSSNQSGRTDYKCIFLFPRSFAESENYLPIAQELNQLPLQEEAWPLQFLCPQPCNVEEFIKDLRNIRPDIVHFECLEDLSPPTKSNSFNTSKLSVSPSELRKIFIPELKKTTDAVLINGNYTREQAIGIIRGVKYLIGIPSTLGKAHRRDFLINFYQKFAVMKNVDQSFTDTSIELIRKTGTEKDSPTLGTVKDGEYIEYHTFNELQQLKQEVAILKEEFQDIESQIEVDLSEELTQRERILKENPHAALANWIYFESDEFIHSISSKLMIGRPENEAIRFQKEFKRLLLLIEGCLVSQREVLISTQNLNSIKLTQPTEQYLKALLLFFRDVQKLKFKHKSIESLQELVTKVKKELSIR